jgi:TetR/AcrR family transcriptional regulator, transcriptional repressor for nem operon
MARPREFNTELVVDKATNLFWKLGYNGTSIQALVDHLALKRGSIYAAFGSKQSLFQLCLNRYIQEQQTKESQILERQLPAIEKINFLLNNAIEDAKYDWEKKGCFLVNTSLESLSNKECASLVNHRTSQLFQIFKSLVKRGISEGDINPDLNVDTTATVILNNLQGMRVIARAGDSQSLLSASAEGIKQLIKR